MSRQTLTSDRKFLVHDFDGVHYDVDGFKPDIYTFCAAIKADVASIMFPFMKAARAEKIGRKSYDRTGDGLNYFTRIAEKLGILDDRFTDRMHIEYHRMQRMRTMETNAHLFVPCERTNIAFDRLQESGVRHGLLTQSCLINWAVPQLKELDRLKYFDADALCGFAEVGYRSKKDSIEPIKYAVNRLGAEPSQIVFLEDNLDNLKRAKEYDERILNVHIVHSRRFDSVPDYVDIRVERPANIAELALSVINPARTYSYPARPELRLTP